MKSLAVTGIICEMQGKGATKHCCDRGFGFSEVKFTVNMRSKSKEISLVRISGEF